MKQFIRKLLIKLLVLLLFLFPVIPVVIDWKFIQVPITAEFIILIICLASAYYIIRKQGLNWRRVAALVLGTILSGVIVFAGVFCNPYWNSISVHDGVQQRKLNEQISYKNAKADVNYMMRYLRKVHIAFRDGTPVKTEAAYNKSLEDLRNTDNITILTLWREMEQILSTLGDAHTNVAYDRSDWHYFKDYDEVTEAEEVLQSVNGVSIQEIYEKNKDLFSYECEEYALYRIQLFATAKEGLQFLGISTDEGIEYEFLKKDNTLDVRQYKADEYISLDDTPVTEKDDEIFVSYEINEKEDTGLFRLDECNYNDTYIQCTKSFFTEVKQKDVRNIIVDLRQNGGGNSYVVNEFIKYLNVDSYRTGSMSVRRGPFVFKSKSSENKNEKADDLIYSGNIYVLTSSYTFSSAMMFTEILADNGFCTVVGEMPANAVNGYGDIVEFQAPHSKLYFSISSKEFKRADEKNKNDFIQPDIECPANQALNRVYERINYK